MNRPRSPAFHTVAAQVHLLPYGYRGLIPAEKRKRNSTGKRRRGDGGIGGKGRAWPRSRLTRWTHYHSSIWGTFGRSDQWLSIPCNGVRSDIRHRGTLYQGRYNWSTLSPPPSPVRLPLFSLPNCTLKMFSNDTGKHACSKSEAYPTTWKDHTGIGASRGFGARGRVRERQARKDGGMEKEGRERNRGEERESRSAPVVPERGPGVKRVPLTSWQIESRGGRAEVDL